MSLMDCPKNSAFSCSHLCTDFDWPTEFGGKIWTLISSNLAKHFDKFWSINWRRWSQSASKAGTSLCALGTAVKSSFAKFSLLVGVKGLNMWCSWFGTLLKMQNIQKHVPMTILEKWLVAPHCENESMLGFLQRVIALGLFQMQHFLLCIVCKIVRQMTSNQNSKEIAVVDVWSKKIQFMKGKCIISRDNALPAFHFQLFHHVPVTSTSKDWHFFTSRCQKPSHLAHSLTMNSPKKLLLQLDADLLSLSQCLPQQIDWIWTESSKSTLLSKQKTAAFTCSSLQLCQIWLIHCPIFQEHHKWIADPAVHQEHWQTELTFHCDSFGVINPLSTTASNQ